MLYLKLWTKTKLKRIATSFFYIFGLIWLFIQPAALFWPDKFDWGWIGYLGMVSASLIIAVIQNFPRRAISKALSAPDSVVEIKIGDLFKEAEHLGSIPILPKTLSLVS